MLIGIYNLVLMLHYFVKKCLLGGELHDYVKGNRKNLLWKRN